MTLDFPSTIRLRHLLHEISASPQCLPPQSAYLMLQLPSFTSTSIANIDDSPTRRSVSSTMTPLALFLGQSSRTLGPSPFVCTNTTPHQHSLRLVQSPKERCQRVCTCSIGREEQQKKRPRASAMARSKSSRKTKVIKALACVTKNKPLTKESLKRVHCRPKPTAYDPF